MEATAIIKRRTQADGTSLATAYIREKGDNDGQWLTVSFRGASVKLYIGHKLDARIEFNDTHGTLHDYGLKDYR